MISASPAPADEVPQIIPIQTESQIIPIQAEPADQAQPDAANVTNAQILDAITSLRQEFNEFVASMRPLLTPQPNGPPRSFPPDRLPVDPRSHAFEFGPLKAFDGIISFLNRECSGSAVRSDVIRVSGSTQYNSSGTYHPNNLTVMNSSSYFHTNGDNLPGGQWVAINFRTMRVTVTHYSILTRGDHYHHHGPKSWAFELSNDGLNWRVVDQRNNDELLNGKGLWASYLIARPDESHFIRIRQLGPSHTGYPFLVIAALELFGAIQLT
jgi:hypothetical protein